MKALVCNTSVFGVCFGLLVTASAGFGDLRRPENVSVESLNTRYVLRWDWPHETTANQTVTFTAQWLEESLSQEPGCEKLWRSVCSSVLEHRCDFTEAKLNYDLRYLLRVRAETSQQSSGWVQIGFCPEIHAALGPPSSVKLNSVKGDLEIIISDPLSSNNQSMKTLLDNNLSYLIQYWRHSEDLQTAKVLLTKNNVVILTELDRRTWYCVRVQSRRYEYYDKSSVFSDTHCTRTEGQMPYWQIFLYIISLLLCFLLVLLLCFCFYKLFTSLKNTFWPDIQLPYHIQELWLSESEKPQLLAPESPESVCEPLVVASAEMDAVEDEQSLNAEDQDFSTHSRTGSGDSGVYSTEEDSGHRSTTHTDLKMSGRKHREELHDGTLLGLCA